MLRPLIDLVLPRPCLSCGQPGTDVCQGCLALAPLPVLGLGVPAWAAAPYDGVLRAALIRYKERGRADLAPVLAHCLSAAVLRLRLTTGTVLIGMPTSATSRHSRGYDHLKLLVSRAGRHLGLQTAAPLRFSRAVRDSAGLGVAERAANLAGALHACAPPRPGSAAVVVDDIVTTGVSARECLRALQAAGWDAVGFAAVAATASRIAAPTARTADGQVGALAPDRKAV